MKKRSSDLIYLLVILLFSVLGMKAFFHPGLFTAHDIWHQVVRLYYYSQGINDGQLPPYWIGQLANNFGYPLFLFSYQLPWLIGIPLLKAGLNIPTTIKALFFISYLGAGTFMYLFVWNLLKDRLSALLAAILYLWLPYHFLILFVSASMGIAFVFTFLPLVFLGIHLLKEEKQIGIPVLALGLTGIILSHIMHLIFLSPIILIFLFWAFANSHKKSIFFKNIGLGLMLGILISSFYLIPASYYSQFTRIRQETGFSDLYKRNFINFNQLIYSKWSFSPIVNNAKSGEISFQLGIAQWISILSLIFLIIFQGRIISQLVFKKLTRDSYALSISMLMGFAVSVFFMLDFSGFFWSSLVKFVVIDFPFRFLLPATFIASICGGIILVNIEKKLRIITFIILLMVAIYTNRNHINVNLYTNFPISTYLNLETEITTNTFNEYLPIKASSKLLGKPWNEIVGESLFSFNTKHNTKLLSFKLKADKEASASVGQFYFPGQTLYLDNKITQFDVDKEGRINFIAPQGTHNVIVKYQETPLIKISKLLTLASILIFFWLFFKGIKLFKEQATSD